MSTHETNSFDSQKAIQHPKVGIKKKKIQSWNFHVPLTSAIASATANAG